MKYVTCIFPKFWIAVKYIFRYIILIISTCDLELFRKLPMKSLVSVAFISLSNMQPLGIGWFFDHTINVHSDIVFTVVAHLSYLVQPNMWQNLFQRWSVHSVVGIFFNHPLNTVEKVFGIGDIIMSTYFSRNLSHFFWEQVAYGIIFSGGLQTMSSINSPMHQTVLLSPYLIKKSFGNFRSSVW